jgi:MFS family permease
VIEMNGMLRIPRSRGALSGVLLILLGAWGGLIAFIGPYFHYAYTPTSAWSYTSGRFWLEIVPAAGAVAGGLILLASSSRPAAMFGAWLAAISGAWFALGSLIGPIWRGHQVSAGTPVGGAVARSLEQIGFFTGLGLAIAFVAGLALGRLTVISVRDTRVAAHDARGEPVTAAPALRGRSARRPTPAGSPGEQPQPEPAGSAAAHR